MSTVDPDARGRHIGQSLKFLVWPALILGVATGPLFSALVWATRGDLFVQALLFYVLASVALGLLVYYLPTRRSPLAQAAYIVQYVGGLFAVMVSTQAAQAFDPTLFWQTSIPVLVPYAVAILLTALYVRRELGIDSTREHGIDTTATVLSAGVNGMVNYVQHYRLTLKFTDNNGVDRFLRIGRTGGGYEAGMTLPLRYDPSHPGSKHRIIVGS